MSILFKVKHSAGKGEGVFATQDIAPGTIIFEEKPTMIIKNEDPSEADVHRAFLKLSESEQDLFRSLHEGPRRMKMRLARIYHENCFESHGACFVCLQVSKINHSCMPNATLTGSEDLSGEILTAIRPIKKGEEVFICYRMDICESSTRAQRQAYLLDYWHFQCQCPACSKTGLARELSDARRMLIHTLRWKIKFTEPFPKQALFRMDPHAIASVSNLTDDTVAATRIYYDQETTVYNFLVAGLLQAEGLPAHRIAVAWHEAAESLLDQINCVSENVILLGAARNVRAWMIKALEMSTGIEQEAHAQNWEIMRQSTQLDIALAYLSLPVEKEACPRPWTVADLAAAKTSCEERLPDSKDFALRFFTFPDGRPGARCIDEQECERLMWRQCLQPKVREKARRNFEHFVKQWRRHLYASEQKMVVGIKRASNDSAVELRDT